MEKKLHGKALDMSTVALRRLLPVAIVVLGSAFVLLMMFFEYKYSDEYDEIISKNIHQSQLVTTNLIHDEFDASRRDLRFLYFTPPIQGIVRASQNNGVDPFDGTTLELWKDRLKTIFTAFAANNPNIFQIRLLLSDGQEYIRVHRDPMGIQVASVDELQNKQDSEYFKRAIHLNPSEVYISEINLNREQGVVQFPYVPTYRIATPIFKANGVLFGFLIANIDAKPLLNFIKSFKERQVTLMLLNGKGNFIVHPNADYEFGDDLNLVHSWQSEFDLISEPGMAGELGEAISVKSNAPFYFQSSTIPLGINRTVDYLQLIVGVTQDQKKAFMSEKRSSAFVTAIVILLLIASFLLFYRHYLRNSLALLEARSEFAAIIDGSQDAIVGMLENGEITTWNPSAERLFGYSEHFGLGKNIFDIIFIHNEDVSKKVNLVLSGIDVPNFETVAIHSSGQEISVSISMSPIVHNGNDIVGVAAIIRELKTL